MKKIELVKIFQSKQALVVDDFTDMRVMMKSMLKLLGCEKIDVACMGNEAVLFCTNRFYDLVLCDYNLGNGKTGQQVLEELRFRGLLKNTSIFLMITAESSRDMVYGTLEYLPDDYLIKPFNQAVFEKRLGRLVVEKDFLSIIYQAMDDKDYHQAIALCESKKFSDPRFIQKCLRIRAWCYFELKQYDSAKALYEIVLGTRDIEWARIGFGKCLLRKNDLDGAHAVLQSLLDSEVVSAEIYDLLAEVEQKRGDRTKAQKMLEEAIKISPHAILRQQNLAKLSAENGDWEAAKKSHMQVMRLSNNSCYDSPENYLDYARCISDQLKSSDPKDTKLVKEAEEILGRAISQFPDNKAVLLQTEFINAKLQLESGNPAYLDKKRKYLEEKMDSVKDAPPELTIDMAKLCQAAGMDDKANELLIALAARFADDEKVSDMIDTISKEPITKIGKKKAANLNQEAKDLFDKNEFKQAIKLIDQALVIFPKNTALNMNLLAALIKQMQSDMVEKKYLQMCDSVILKVGVLDTEHPQFKKFTGLCGEIKRLKSSFRGQ